jgi:PHD/YefM family antitoxin component YafN of YafNO toxin-antitoxin module
VIDFSDSHSLADFQQNADEHLKRLKASGKPEVLTVDGQPEVIIQSASAYQKLVDAAELFERLQVLRKSLDEANRGEGTPAKDVLREIRVRLGLGTDA